MSAPRLPIARISSIALLTLVLGLAQSALACDQWLVPARLTVQQSNGYWVTFQLKQDGSQLSGYGAYRTTQRIIYGNASGSIVNDTFHLRVLWTYSGVNSIGQYAARIKPDGSVFEGTTYDEYVQLARLESWSGSSFACRANPETRSGTILGRVPPTPAAGPERTICEVAHDARARNSPAAPGLEAQCRAAGGGSSPAAAATDKKRDVPSILGRSGAP